MWLPLLLIAIFATSVSTPQANLFCYSFSEQLSYQVVKPSAYHFLQAITSIILCRFICQEFFFNFVISTKHGWTGKFQIKMCLIICLNAIFVFTAVLHANVYFSDDISN